MCCFGKVADVVVPSPLPAAAAAVAAPSAPPAPSAPQEPIATLAKIPETDADADDAETEADTEAEEAQDAEAEDDFHRFHLTTLDGKEVQLGIATDGKTITVDLDYLEGTMTLPALQDMAAQIAAEAETELFEPVDNDDLTVSQLLILCLLSAIIGTITAYMAYVYRIY
jgi:hypothetical protein